jgi:diguanylate cyclase (GGDEF)-like protein
MDIMGATLLQKTARLLHVAMPVLACIGLALACGQDAWAQPAPATPPPASAHDATLARCFSLQRSEPGAAITVADALLKTPGLPVEVEIKALSCLGMASSIAGDGKRGTAAAARIESLLGEHAMPAAFELRALSNAGAIFHASGQVYRGLSLYLRAEQVAEAEEVHLVQIATLTNIGLIYGSELGAYRQAEDFFRRAQDISRVHGHEDPLLAYNRALNYIRWGRDDDASKELERAASAARRADNKLVGYRVASERAGIMVRAGQGATAQRSLQQVLEAQRTLPDPAGESTSLVHLSAAQLAQGDAAGALRNARAAEQLALQPGFRLERGAAMAAQVKAYRALGTSGEALAIALRLHRIEIDALRDYNLQGLARLSRLQDAANAREVERLRHESEMQALSLANTRRLRNWALSGLFLLVAVGGAFALLQRRSNAQLRRLSRVDGLTGLMNRRAASSRLDSRLGEGGTSADVRGVVLLIDVDHFKSINDRYGHAAGDRVLVALSERLKSFCRPDDIVSRWGGEEFMIACPRITLEQAQRVAERLRAVAADTRVAISETESVALTISIGFAPFPFHGNALPAETWQDAIRLADRALYAAKDSGRDAWVGVWGHGPAGLALNTLLAQLGQAELNDSVEVVSTRPVVWRDTVRPDHG